MKPSVGDMVHFVGVDAHTYAAIVTRVIEGGLLCDLAVFLTEEGTTTVRVANVHQQREAAELGTWRPRPGK